MFRADFTYNYTLFYSYNYSFPPAVLTPNRSFSTICSLFHLFSASTTWMLLIFAMLSGGCTRSTSGGVKNLRLIIIANCIRNQFRQILHPRAVLPVRAGFPFDNKLVTTVLVFFAAYLSVAFIGWTLLMAFGVDFTEAMSTVISAMGNVGPGLGSFGPAFSWAALPDAAKWILSSLMLIGRLEIFGFLLIFYRSTWKGSWS